MQPKRFFWPLKATSGDIVTLDITSSSRRATFRLDNIPVKHGDEFCYAEKIRLWIRTQVDQPAADGAIIRADQLYRILSGFRLSSDDLGTLYGLSDISGPALGLWAQVISNGYRLPFHLREDIAAADGDTAIVLPIDIPIAHKCFMKGHQTGLWNGWLKNGGVLDVDLSASTALAAVSTGAALEATTAVAAELVYVVEPEARPPVIWTWRQRDTLVGETRHSIPNIAQGAGIVGSMGIGKIAALIYLTDVNGLGGPDGVDNIQRIFPSARGQASHDLGAPFYGPASFLASFVEDTREKNVFPTTNGNGYPYSLGTAINGVPNAATALGLPLFWPAVEGQEVSKLQEWSGSYPVELTYTSTPAAVAKWLSLETSYINENHKDYLARRMGVPPELFYDVPKVKILHSAGGPEGQAKQEQKLRGVPRKYRERGM